MEAQPTVARRTYLLVFVALMALLALTVTASELNLGPLLSVAVALTIAVGKALLILLYFMHVRYSGRLVWVFALAGFFWLGILLVLAMSDYISRGWLPVPGA